MFSALLIDGYNLLHVLGFVGGKVSAKGLEAARLRMLDHLVPLLGAQAGHVTVVFDASGKVERLLPQSPYHAMAIRYSGMGKEADDVIEDEIAACSQPTKLAVVSSDRRLQDAARRRGATSFSCTAFLDWLEERNRPEKVPTPAPVEKPLPTEQNSAVWLKEFAGLADDPELKEIFDEINPPGDFEEPPA